MAAIRVSAKPRYTLSSLSETTGKRQTHLSFRLDRIRVPLRHLSDGFASPKLSAHDRVAHGHHGQRYDVGDAQKQYVVSGTNDVVRPTHYCLVKRTPRATRAISVNHVSLECPNFQSNLNATSPKEAFGHGPTSSTP